MPDTPADAERWQRLLHHSTDALFVLNRQRRLLYANAAWEQLTGVTLPEARRRVCRPYREAAPGSVEAVLSSLHPSAEALAGQPVQMQRRRPGGHGFWAITFFPLSDADGFCGLLGKVSSSASATPPTETALPERLLALRRLAERWCHLDQLHSEAPAMQRVLEQVRLARQTRVPVLLCGPPGAGKEWLARVIHQGQSSTERFFAALDCARLPADYVQRILFDPAHAAVLGQVATLYLRAPERLPREVQQQLADALREPESLPQRIVAGTSRDVGAEVATGRLLEVLACRLSVLTIAVPPLRERSADYPLLVERLLARLGEEKLTLSTAAWEAVRAFAWPGNVRELLETLTSARRRATGAQIDVGDLPWQLRGGEAPALVSLPLKTLLEEVERRLLERALELSGGNKTQAAKILWLDRPQLWQRLKKYRIAGYEADDGP